MKTNIDAMAKDYGLKIRIACHEFAHWFVSLTEDQQYDLIKAANELNSVKFLMVCIDAGYKLTVSDEDWYQCVSPVCQDWITE